jgi:DNA-binding MarR family transcriptional regulator
MPSGRTAPSKTGGALTGAVLTAARALDRRVEAAIADVGLSVDSWRVLDLVVTSPGRSMREISDSLVLPAATATRMVDQLVSVGLVYRGVAVEDRRCVILQPTDSGRTVLRDARRAIARVEDSARKALRSVGIDPAALTAALGNLSATA